MNFLKKSYVVIEKGTTKYSIPARLAGTVGQKSPLCGFPHTWVVGGTKLATLTTV